MGKLLQEAAAAAAEAAEADTAAAAAAAAVSRRPALGPAPLAPLPRGLGPARGPARAAGAGRPQQESGRRRSAALQGEPGRWECGLGPAAPAAAGPLPEPAGGSVAAGPGAGAAGGGSAEAETVASGPEAALDGGSVKTAAQGPARWAAGRSPAGPAAAAAAAASGPAAKGAGSSAVATGPEAQGTHETIQPPPSGALTSCSSLPGGSNGVPLAIVKAGMALARKGRLAAVAAAKRRSKRVPVNGAPAVKLLKLPGPDDVHNPALMEALKAVVAAGGSGWLDPAAVAAVRTELEVECSCEEDLDGERRETSGESSKPEQRTWTPALLVTERRRKKKPVSQERAALVNLVPCTEESTKDPKHNSLWSEDQAEACSVEPMLSFSPPESPITARSMVPGGGNFVQAEPKEIWICGHSVILVTKRRASTHPHGLQLGFPSSSAFLYWHGIQAMLWDQLLPLLHEIYYLRSFPSVIVIHLGENDLVQHTSMSLIVKMKNDLGILRRAFPDAHIIWSSLLPRRFWKGAEKPVNLEKAREGINKEMSHYCSENGIIFLRHDLITYNKPNMFLPDVDDLSDAGADVFTADLKGALHSCLDFGKG